MEENKKYNAVELVFGGFFTLGVDIVSAILDFLVIGLILSPILQGGTMFILSFWARSKGDKNSLSLGRQVIKQASNLLPVIPTCFAVFIIETYLHNHPKSIASQGLNKISQAQNIGKK